MFRVVVQDSRRTPTSGKVVAWLGSYDPHSKTLSIDKEKASFYVNNGAQPTDRLASILKSEGVKLPDWVSVASGKKRGVRNPDKRRSTRPPEPVEEAEKAAEAPADTEAEAAEVTAETAENTAQSEDAPAE